MIDYQAKAREWMDAFDDFDVPAVAELLRSVAADARKDALEEAAQACDQRAEAWASFHSVAPSAARDCATSIRALAGRKETGR